MKKETIQQLIELRHILHQNPELSGLEFKTAKRIIEFISECNSTEILHPIGETGILATFKGKNPGPTTLIRCELDALPIQEINNFEHKSGIEGVSHKCGHDGHMAILCGVATLLSDENNFNGTVHLLFQPAEEDGEGAKRVLNDPLFNQIKPDFVFALHNLPGFSLGQIVVKNETFSCAVNSMIIQLSGKTAHAGEPENGINPALAISEIISNFNLKIQSDISLESYCLITPIYINMGKKAYGVSAGFGEIHFTIRSNSNKNMDRIQRELIDSVTQIATSHKLKPTIDWAQQFRANENNKEAVSFIRKAAEINGYDIFEKETPFSWGEDFGLFTEYFPGAMFGLGAGENVPSLHNPDYDFPDELIPIGAKMFYQIIKEIHHAH
ncbi:amidohydrolase [Flavobacterium antarcticum]|uniref:amidohydrolase n=1 Tax=Flavobacterium antarcticum TaxID=271155 RepID=UPI0003B7452E|nr:amidohydrolase [Flavobacterium antarcticum]